MAYYDHDDDYCDDDCDECYEEGYDEGWRDGRRSSGSSRKRPAQTSSEGCYIATAIYGSYDCPEVWMLRRYRDNVLAHTQYGRAFIHTYYAISPKLVKWFSHTVWFKRFWKKHLDQIVNRLRSSGVQDTPYEDKNWR